MKGPAIFLAQLLREQPPFDRLASLARWVAERGYTGVQIASWDRRALDLDQAAQSQAYCDDYRADIAEVGLVVSEIGAQLQGQALAMHPAYEQLFQPFYPQGLSSRARSEWAADQLSKAVRASARMGLSVIPMLSGGFAWHLAYPWPPTPTGLIDEAFQELARLWRPLLDQAREAGIAFAFELHPGSDLFDGATYERFLDITDDHPAACLNYDPSHFVLQQLDYIDFIRLYGPRIKGFHVKDAEFRPSGRIGVYGGFQPWQTRAGRFRSLGDGQVDFRHVFTALTEVGYSGWAVLEWECCVKSAEQGVAEGASFIRAHMIQKTSVAFDDFAGAPTDSSRNRAILRLE